MTSDSVMRIIDENLDRLAEGLRVLEDFSRMLLNDAGLTSRLKDLRHRLIRADLPFNLALLSSRDASHDVGEKLEVASEPAQPSLPLIALANARRAQEALRVLEDLAKLPPADLPPAFFPRAMATALSPDSQAPERLPVLDSARFKAARFALYEIEREVVGRLARRESASLVRGLYVIVDLEYLGPRDPLEITRQLLGSEVKIIQLRAKNTPEKRLFKLAEAMQTLCRENAAKLIINDHLDIALAVQADGLHIGQDDLPAAVARRWLPVGALLGVSAATGQEARAAEEAGADYLGVGAIFATTSKDNIAAVGLNAIKEIRSVTHLPLAAIGGLNLNNIAQVMLAGADAACVISAVLGAPDPAAAARALIQKIEALK
jgi:thiamine-phosphate pyrophosphorylase